jgi:hypothetical protein
VLTELAANHYCWQAQNNIAAMGGGIAHSRRWFAANHNGGGAFYYRVGRADTHTHIAHYSGGQAAN